MSFISVEPQSRVFLESHSNALLAQFDIQLDIITDRYLAFFQERRKIEASYINSLRSLHRKATIVDTSFDARAETTTTRAAWDRVRDNLEREANVQQAFVDSLDNDVIKPLSEFKETEDQKRKRVEKDLEESASNYADHAENTIWKLQQACFEKYHPRFGGKVSALFRGRPEDLQKTEPAKSEEVTDDDCRKAVSRLNSLRLMRVESLGDGYDCLGELFSTPTVKDVLVKYVGSIVIACKKYDEVATSTSAEVDNALNGTDTSDLRASFRRAFSFSIPPLTLYRNYPPDAYSDLIFGVPLVDLTTNQDNVPKVMRMCIEEVEKRGLDTHNIYSKGSIDDAEVLQLRRRFESDKTFSFSSTDNIHSIAMLLKLYFRSLPEPLFMLSLEDYRQYRQNGARYTENDCSVLRSKIRELHPAHKASLEALLRHLLRVASHSDKNAMTVETLAGQFCYTVLRGNAVLEDGIHVKALVMVDLIQNAHILFDERPPPFPPVPSPRVAETTPAPTYGSLLSEFSQSAETQAMGSTIRHRPGLFGSVPTSTQSSFTSRSDSPVEGRFIPALDTLLSPLLGHRSSQTLEAGVETTTQEQVIPEARGTQAVETSPNSSSPGVGSLPPTFFAEWHIPHPEAPIIPQSPSESDFSLSPAASYIFNGDFLPAHQ